MIESFLRGEKLFLDAKILRAQTELQITLANMRSLLLVERSGFQEALAVYLHQMFHYDAPAAKISEICTKLTTLWDEGETALRSRERRAMRAEVDGGVGRCRVSATHRQALTRVRNGAQGRSHQW
jgi:hypothetical protein